MPPKRRDRSGVLPRRGALAALQTELDADGSAAHADALAALQTELDEARAAAVIGRRWRWDRNAALRDELDAAKAAAHDAELEAVQAQLRSVGLRDELDATKGQLAHCRDQVALLQVTVRDLARQMAERESATGEAAGRSAEVPRRAARESGVVYVDVGAGGVGAGGAEGGGGPGVLGPELQPSAPPPGTLASPLDLTEIDPKLENLYREITELRAKERGMWEGLAEGADDQVDAGEVNREIKKKEAAALKLIGPQMEQALQNMIGLISSAGVSREELEGLTADQLELRAKRARIGEEEIKRKMDALKFLEQFSSALRRAMLPPARAGGGGYKNKGSKRRKSKRKKRKSNRRKRKSKRKSKRKRK